MRHPPAQRNPSPDILGQAQSRELVAVSCLTQTGGLDLCDLAGLCVPAKGSARSGVVDQELGVTNLHPDA